MKHALIIAAALSLFSAAAVNAGSTPVFMGSDTAAQNHFYTVKKNIKVHKSPGLKTGVIARADSGELCRYEYRIGEWFLVKFPDQRKGFVHASLLSPYAVGAGGLREKDPVEDSTVSGGMDFPPAVKDSLRRWEFIVSLLCNLLLLGFIVRNWYNGRSRAATYDEMRELANIEESKETMKRELFSCRPAE